MSGSSFSSGPSRKSRFRPQRPGEERQIESAPANLQLKLDEPGAGEAGADPAAPTPELFSGAQIVMRPRQPVPRARYSRKQSIFKRWRLPLQMSGLLVIGLVGGYLIGISGPRPGSAARGTARPLESVGMLSPLTDEEQAELDKAYDAQKAGRFDDSIQMLAALIKKHPAWARIPVDIARMQIYQRAVIPARRLLGELSQGNTDARPDAFLLMGILAMTSEAYADAEVAFAQATAADPTRSEFYYFWGDCLRRDGKPTEAGVRFRSALNRNQFETARDLLRLKIWLCDLMSDQAKSDQASSEIDALLARPFPSAGVYMAAAARSIKAEHFAEAASFITRGEAAMDPAVFNVVLVDPTFAQEGWRPELAPFYERSRVMAGRRRGAASPAPANANHEAAPPAKGPATSPAAPGH